jgi:queuine tRNA-ribosyltransferase
VSASFELIARDGEARRGRLQARARRCRYAGVHAGRNVRRRQGDDARRHWSQSGAQIILSNTFHLWLRPRVGSDRRARRIASADGMEGPILTDSGGFQVFSLGALRKISEEGVAFQSPVNGDRCFPLARGIDAHSSAC